MAQFGHGFKTWAVKNPNGSYVRKFVLACFMLEISCPAFLRRLEVYLLQMSNGSNNFFGPRSVSQNLGPIQLLSLTCRKEQKREAIGPEDLPPSNQHFSKVGFWRNNCTRKKVLAGTSSQANVCQFLCHRQPLRKWRKWSQRTFPGHGTMFSQLNLGTSSSMSQNMVLYMVYF